MDSTSFMGMTEDTVFAVGIPIVFLLIAIEVLVASRTGRRYYTKGDTLGTVGLLVGNVIVSLLAQSLSIAAFVLAYQYRIFNLSETLPAWLLLIVALVLIDIAFYIFHRLSHRVRFFWAIHLSHHSSEQFNFVVAFRQAWLAPIVKIPFFAPLALVGLHPAVVAVVGTISTLYGVWTHTQIVPKLGFLEWWLGTPSAHRVHHGANPQYIDKNYANMFILIDRICGTYEPELEPVKYGLSNNVNTFNPFKITMIEWKRMWADVRTARTVGEVLGYILGPPNWKPLEIGPSAIKGARDIRAG